MEYRDYYQVLGVKRDASQAEIKRAFRKLAREHHPDRNPGDAAAEPRFKEVNEANEVLSDPDKRTRYDQLGANWDAFSRTGAGGADPFGPGGPFAGSAGGRGGVRYEFRQSAEGGGFSDFFRTFFSGASAGAAAGSARGRRGATSTADGQSFEDILAGLGLGDTPPGGSADFGSWTADPAASRPRTGRARSSATPSVEAEVDVTLEEAFHGTTRLVEVDGKRLEVAVPRGVETGSRIRLKGRGGGDPAHPADLYLVTRVRHHPVYQPDRRGSQPGAPDHARRGAPGRPDPAHDAQGPDRPDRPRADPERPDLPAQGPGHAPAQAQGGRTPDRRPPGEGPGRPADGARPTRPSKRLADSLDLGSPARSPRRR